MPFFAGQFVYFADAANVTDCATGVRLPVAMKDAYIHAERAYTAMSPAMGEGIYVEFFGHISDEPRMEGNGTERAFVIDSLIGFDRNKACRAQWLLAGVYESTDGGIKRVLRLRPDYSFSETIFESEENVKREAGRWYRNAELELVLEISDPKTKSATFEVIPAKESLSRSNDKTPLVYKKVYL